MDLVFGLGLGGELLLLLLNFGLLRRYLFLLIYIAGLNLLKRFLFIIGRRTLSDLVEDLGNGLF